MSAHRAVHLLLQEGQWAHDGRGNRQVLCRGSFAHCDMPMSLCRFHNDRNIVAEGCQDHDEARLRVTVNVTTQDSRDVWLANARARSISANESDDIDLSKLLRLHQLYQ
jgi:hypothetical protein